MSLAQARRMARGNSFKPSASATMFLDELEKRWGKIEREVEIGGRLFDGRVGEYLIEVDSDFYHSTPKQKRIDAIKESVATRNKYTLFRFRHINDVRAVHKFFEEEIW